MKDTGIFLLAIMSAMLLLVGGLWGFIYFGM